MITASLRRRLLTWTGYLAVAVAVLLVASRIPRTLTVFAIAAFIAAGLTPLVRSLDRFMPRALAITLVYVGLGGLLAVLALLVVPATFGEAQTLAANSPVYLANLAAEMAHVETALREHFGRSYLPPGYSNLGDYLSAQAVSSFNVVIGSLTGIFVWTANALFVAVSAIVLSAFFVIQGRTIIESFYDSLPSARRERVRALGHEIGRVFVGFVAGQAVLCAVTGVAIFAFSAIAGFKFALLLGIFSGLAYAVPFVGMVAAQLIAVLLALPQGGTMVAWVSVIVFVVARISDTVLVPKVMSDSVGVSPIAVMFAVFAGGELFGLAGLVLGIPAAALANVAWKFYHLPEARPETLPSVAAVPADEDGLAAAQAASASQRT